MPLNYFLGVTKEIGDLEIDVVTREQIDMPSETTDHPVEGGFEISDNVVNKPIVLRMTCFLGQSNLNNFQDDRLQKYNALKNLRNERTPITVVSGLEVFDNMVITNITIPRDVFNASGLEFDIELKQITIINSERRDLAQNASDDVKDKAGTTKDGGRVTGKEASPKVEAKAEEKKSSILTKVFQ
jgi:hypothetical protein